MRAQVNLNSSSHAASLNISCNSYIPMPMPPVQRNRQDAPADVFNYIEMAETPSAATIRPAAALR